MEGLHSLSHRLTPLNPLYQKSQQVLLLMYKTTLLSVVYLVALQSQKCWQVSGT